MKPTIQSYRPGSRPERSLVDKLVDELSNPVTYEKIVGLPADRR